MFKKVHSDRPKVTGSGYLRTTVILLMVIVISIALSVYFNYLNFSRGWHPYWF